MLEFAVNWEYWSEVMYQDVINDNMDYVSNHVLFQLKQSRKKDSAVNVAHHVSSFLVYQLDQIVLQK